MTTRLSLPLVTGHVAGDLFITRKGVNTLLLSVKTLTITKALRMFELLHYILVPSGETPQMTMDTH